MLSVGFDERLSNRSGFKLKQELGLSNSTKNTRMHTHKFSRYAVFLIVIITIINSSSLALIGIMIHI